MPWLGLIMRTAFLRLELDQRLFQWVVSWAIGLAGLALGCLQLEASVAHCGGTAPGSITGSLKPGSATEPGLETNLQPRSAATICAAGRSCSKRKGWQLAKPAEDRPGGAARNRRRVRAPAGSAGLVVLMVGSAWGALAGVRLERFWPLAGSWSCFGFPGGQPVDSWPLDRLLDREGSGR